MGHATGVVQEVVQQEEEGPRLIVLLVVDQLIPEQLLRLDPWLDGGLGRLVRKGRFFPEAAFDHARTETGPGHATVVSGLQPRRHGIVGNAFFERDSERSRYCIEDLGVQALRAGSEEGTRSGRIVSPRTLRAATLGELIKAAHPDSRVVSISGKDRAAVLMGGTQADWALWWDRQVGGFASTDYYGERLPDWVSAFNDTWLSRSSGWRWEPSWQGALVGSGTAFDLRVGESGLRPTLPRVYSEVPADSHGRERALLAGALYSSPQLDEFVVDLGLAALDAQELGADESPDLLCLGLSACDTIGHAHGPCSVETTDIVLRLDDQLERLFLELDQRIGEGRWLAVLTADHGVLPLPERLRSEGIGSERLPMRVIGELLHEVKQALEESYGQTLGAIWEDGIVLHWPTLEEAELDPTEVRKFVAEVVAGADWVARTYTFDQLESGADSEDPWLRLAANSFVPDRSPDVVLQRHPWSLIGMNTGTSHGSPYEYDRRVPMVFYGPGVVAGRDHSFVSVVDLLPTLMTMAGLPVPGDLEGEVLALR